MSASVAAAVGSALVVHASPAVGLGLVAVLLLFMLPWGAVFLLLAVAAMFSRIVYDVGGLSFRPEQFILVVLAIRIVAPAALNRRLRWGVPESLLVAFLLVEALSSIVRSPDVRTSFLSLALMGFGATAYVVTSGGCSSERRLVSAARAILFAIAITSAIGLGALASHLLFGTSWGIEAVQELGATPGLHGLAWERNIFGSTSAAGAIAFLVLWRERNSVLSRLLAVSGMVICLLATMASLSRGAWVGLVAALGVALVASTLSARAGKRRLRSAVLGLVVAGIVVIGFSGMIIDTSPGGREVSLSRSISTQAARVVDFGSETGTVRLVVWKAALEDVSHSVLLGLGTNSFGARHADLQAQFGSPAPLFISNLLLRTFYDSGLLGLTLFLAFLLPLLWPSRELIESDAPAAPLARAFTFASGALFVAYMATDASLLVSPWIILGLLRASRAFIAPTGAGEQSGRARTSWGQPSGLPAGYGR